MRRTGDVVPQVTFRLRREGAWLEMTSAEIFKGRSVVLFGLPAAFSTTCAARHLAGYVALSRNIRAMGIDEICCLSVNDAFVMNAWARDQGIDDEVTLLPDGNAAFTRQMGMLVDKVREGFGERSWRYSMVVEDGVIRQARLALGGVAAKPWRARAAEGELAGAGLDGTAFRRAAEIALAGAEPSGDNAFKIALAKRIVVRALARAAAGTPDSLPALPASPFSSQSGAHRHD